jgi:hypothetical protein
MPQMKNEAPGKQAFTYILAKFLHLIVTRTAQQLSSVVRSCKGVNMPLHLHITTICNFLCILFTHEIKQPRMANYSDETVTTKKEVTSVIINLAKLKITSDIKNNCISDVRSNDLMSGYMMTEDPENNSQWHVRKNTELHHHY